MKTLMIGVILTLALVTFGGPKECTSDGGCSRGGATVGSDPVVRLVTNAKFAEKIGLSEEQRKQIKEISKTNREGSGELRARLGESMKRQAMLLKAEKIDEAAVMAEIDKSFEIRKEMAKSQTRRVIAIKSILTPEQVAKALEEAKSLPKRAPKAKKNAAVATPAKN